MAKNKGSVKKINNGTKVWIDLQNPSHSQLTELQSKYNLHEDDIRATTDNITTPKT